MPCSTHIAASVQHPTGTSSAACNACSAHCPHLFAQYSLLHPRAPLSPAHSPPLQDLPRFFSPSAVVVWEGNSVTGSAQLTHLFSVLPPTKHTLTSIDCHPLTPPTPATAASAPQSLLVSVSGTVVYGLDSGGVRGFFHSFVLEKGSGGAGYSYVVSASFRTRQVVEPEKPKKPYRSSV